MEQPTCQTKWLLVRFTTFIRSADLS